MANVDSNDLPRRTASDKVLLGNTFNITKNPKCDGCKRGFVSMVNKCFDKTCTGGVVTRADKSAIKTEIMPNQQLAGESYKPIIWNFERKKIGKYNKGARFFSCVIDAFSKYIWALLEKQLLTIFKTC